MDHKETIKTIYDKLLGLKVPEKQYIEAKKHIAQCPSCLAEVDLMMSMVKGKSVNLVNKVAQEFGQRLNKCKELGELLEEMNPDDIQAHIKSCPICGFLVQSVDQLSQAAESFTYKEAAELATHSQTVPIPELWQEIKTGYYQLTVALNFIITETKTCFAGLPDFIRSDKRLRPAAAVRGSAKPSLRDKSLRGEYQEPSDIIIPHEEKNKTVSIQFEGQDSIKICLNNTAMKSAGNDVTIDLIHPESRRTFISKPTEIGKPVAFKITEKMQTGFIISIKYKDLNWEIPLSLKEKTSRQ
ncbi:hypothetical protein JW935_21920 [candidate division KSB1 bacterium]|nr:hypothetical protein [candidate division KSB1 bacterium]